MGDLMIQVYTDAAVNPKSQLAVIAIRIDSQTQTEKVPIACDNHYAEFYALKRALEEIKETTQTIICYTDSKVVAQSIEKRYVHQEAYKPLLAAILRLQEQFSLVFVKWIPEKENKAADIAAKQFLYQIEKGR